MSEPETCANCRFYRPAPNSVPAGHCHRRAPERGYLDCGAWPSVPPEEWCGEWEAKKAAVPTDGQAEQPAGASGLREVRFDLVAAEDAIADAYRGTGDYSAGLVAVVVESVLTQIGMKYAQIEVGSNRETITAVLDEPIGGGACTGG